MNKISLKKGILGVACSALLVGNAFAATTADFLFVVDESGSMSGEHSWLSTMVSSLDSKLNAAGSTGNRFGLVGYGASGVGLLGHKHVVGSGDFGSAAEFTTAASGLTLTGGTEDGWQAIDFALNNYSIRSNAALNVVLVTDEDRDITSAGASLTYNGLLAALKSKNALLNAVVNASLYTDLAVRALGHDSAGNAYLEDGSGGYTTDDSGSKFGTGTTIADYYDLALGTGGAVWDLNQLRAGGDTATSFTQAFVDIKVREVINQTPTSVPDSGSTAMFLLASIGAITLIRRRKQ
jgi:hypothetical protein